MTWVVSFVISSAFGPRRAIESRSRSNSTKRPPTASSDGHESIQGSEGASTLQSAEIALLVVVAHHVLVVRVGLLGEVPARGSYGVANGSQAIDATRGHLTMTWVVSGPNLSQFIRVGAVAARPRDRFHEDGVSRDTWTLM